MATVVRVSGLAEHSWVAQVAPPELVWWLIRAAERASADEAPRDVAAATSRLLCGDRWDGGAWVARVEGSAEAVRYTTATVPGDLHRVGFGRHRRWAVLSDLDTLGALAVLDAAETVGVGVVLFRGGDDGSAALVAALSGSTPMPTTVRPDLVVMASRGGLVRGRHRARGMASACLGGGRPC